MIVLAIDTALGACAAGVWQDGAMVAEEHIAMTQGHAEALMPMIERVMSAAHLTYNDIDRIGVTVGPGSFTGVRVGLATARGIALAAHKPAIGIPTTEALAAPALERKLGRPVIAVIDSKRGDVFAQTFAADGSALNAPMNIAFEKLRELVSIPCSVVGDAALQAATHIGEGAQALPLDGASNLAPIARLAAGRAPEPQGPLPLYIRPPDVTMSAGGGALRP